MSPNRKYDFSGKVALVTGSSSGIGAAIAVQFAQYGAKVAITGRNAENLNKIAQKIIEVSHGVKPLEIIGDLTDPAFPKKLISETVSKFGRLDFLVNNAGAGSANGSLASPNLLEEFDKVFTLNLRSVVELTQLAVPHLEKTKGNVINISSAISIKPHVVVYSSSKAGLDMVTKCSALELGPKGIRVNSINPGLVRTAFTRSVGLDESSSAAFYDYLEKQSLMKTIGTSDDIANLASFLASDDARNITGSILLNDSGYLVHAPAVNREELMKALSAK